MSNILTFFTINFLIKLLKLKIYMHGNDRVNVQYIKLRIVF